MGCSTSKLDDEEVVQLCKDRKRFIKQAVEQRSRFASWHIAYVQSLKRVSVALRDYVEGDEPREFLLDSSFITPPLKKGSSRFISISPNSVFQSDSKSTLKVNYLRPGGTPAVSVEERPRSPETFRVETYSPMHQFGIDGFFAMQSSTMNPSYFSYSPNDRPNLPPPSPQATQWDFFWNPFSSLDYYGYPTRSSLDQAVMDDEMRGLRQVREEEGIPDLEEDETEKEETESMTNVVEERDKIDSNSNCCRKEVLVEDVDEDEEDDDEDTDCVIEIEHDVKDLQSQGKPSIEISRAQTTGPVEFSTKEMAVGKDEATKETQGFTVYVNRRPTNMAEVIDDLEAQFMKVYKAANAVSALLEASKAQYTTPSNEITAAKMLNPVALIRSASSRSTSSRFLMKSSSSKEDGYESTDFSDESCMFHGSHQSTLDRLYVWEKKLYEEVRSGEKVRIAYEKKFKQLRSQDVKGGESFCTVDKTIMALRDLDTQIKVSLQTVGTISKRIEALRDEELQPQLLELLQGFARMWKVMAECHQTQKRTLDEAKLLLAGTPSKLQARRRSSISVSDPQRLARSAANLESELRNWRACFESWITSQRSYVHALTGWLLRCLRFEPDTSKLPFSPHRSSGTLPVFGLCIQWSRFLDALHEVPVLDGLDFCAAGMGSLYAQQLKDDSHGVSIGSKRFSEVSPGKLDLVQIHQVEEEVMTAEKLAEVAIRVLCAGMSVAMSSLSEFSISSDEGYAELVNQWENAKRPRNSGGTGI